MLLVTQGDRSQVIRQADLYEVKKTKLPDLKERSL